MMVLLMAMIMGTWYSEMIVAVKVLVYGKSGLARMIAKVVMVVNTYYGASSNGNSDNEGFYSDQLVMVKIM